ncbi:MAG: hypothetical protein JSU70_02380 [Phycisphaerales bacterium]|nr:MAG: hypothetical protein JSU70_02380 [Phycisphaerales bacterium]
MSESAKTFRDKLLALEEPDPTYREKYERQVTAMVEQKLTGAKKWQMIFFLVMSISLGLFFGTMAVIAPAGFPWWGRALFVAGAVFCLAFVTMYARILQKGSINLKKDNIDLAWTGWGFVVIVGTAALVISPKLPDRIAGVHWLVSVLFFLVAAGVFLLRAFIERSELNTREKLLEIELRLAELTEKIDEAHVTQEPRP